MSYEPREGVDYLVDLYALANVPRTSDAVELRRVLNERLMEYHPDRLQGLAPEFVEKGERMARLLNRARTILLDGDRRTEYDAMLAEWTGPLSGDGTPVLTMERYVQGSMEGKSADEIEEVFGRQKAELELLTGYRPGRLSLLERLVEEAGEDVPEDLRAEYEDALSTYDSVLSVQESERARLLGIDTAKWGHAAALDYTEGVAGEIEAARRGMRGERRRLALGCYGTRLALLAGEPLPAETAETPLAVTGTDLPAYFDSQAEKVLELARERELILVKRLENFEPDFPAAELQREARTSVLVGIGTEELHWLGMEYDPARAAIDNVAIPEEINGLLGGGDYPEVIRRGYNVMIFPPLERVDLRALLQEAMQRYVARFFPEE